MRPPVIPDIIRVCRVCEEDLAVIGGLCFSCDELKRCVEVALGGDLKPGTVFVVDPRTETFVPVEDLNPYLRIVAETARDMPIKMHGPAPRITEAPCNDPHCPCGGAGHPPRQPRREQYALPASAEGEAVARRVTSWVGLLLLVTFFAGWAFGRFA